jgi:phage-related protein
LSALHFCALFGGLIAGAIYFFRCGVRESIGCPGAGKKSENSIMSGLTYARSGITLIAVNGEERPIVWLRTEMKTPPFSREARIEAGTLLRRLQRGEMISLPHSRPVPSIGKRCHELRIVDEDATWRIVYRLDSDAVIIGEVFSKKTRATPKKVIDTCKARFKQYDQASE